MCAVRDYACALQSHGLWTSSLDNGSAQRKAMVVAQSQDQVMLANWCVECFQFQPLKSILLEMMLSFPL